MMLVGGHEVAEEEEIVDHFGDVCFVCLPHHLFSLSWCSKNLLGLCH